MCVCVCVRVYVSLPHPLDYRHLRSEDFTSPFCPCQWPAQCFAGTQQALDEHLLNIRVRVDHNKSMFVLFSDGWTFDKTFFYNWHFHILLSIYFRLYYFLIFVYFGLSCVND